ncbi:MAG: type 2 isopentenyl-diphosphate Delta-isomerase [Candidatus Marinimicrobia bacterium]|nr:type 2 isopentenyl-diphosphate Delta-isomerase [Candidatus Neomarinimicrobiota bacterium]MCF7922448.1 type 2 isopentenyl-diphosphate Delta-isomerase [Candidatus Neomarinimicrobiota bacterium]
MTRVIEQRKRDHLNLAQNEALNFSISAGFNRWRFIHNALPEINLSDIDTRCTFLGKELKFPLLISSMSGGVQESYHFNARLASAAEAVGCALGLGSIRAALENEEARDSFLVAREQAPTAVILANLGIAQILTAHSMDRVARFCEDLSANALIIHLNPLQEAFQPEGDTKFAGGLAAIQKWVQEFPLPIIVKEVGQGLSLAVISRLQGVGVEIIDIAGAGGSNWISIEGARLSEDQSVLKKTAQEFANWGEPTAEILENLSTNQFVIASGGLKRPLDLPKALGLGANMGGIAGILLKQALKDDADKLSEALLVWKKTLEMTMFGAGVRTIDELIGNRQLLQKID